MRHRPVAARHRQALPRRTPIPSHCLVAILLDARPRFRLNSVPNQAIRSRRAGWRGPSLLIEDVGKIMFNYSTSTIEAVDPDLWQAI
ncbi:hypothetical protein, partial [Burkholderia gladioli]